MPLSHPTSPLETGISHNTGANTLLTVAQNHALEKWLAQLPSQLGTVLLTHDHTSGSEPICRELIRRLPETHHVAWVLQPRLSLLDFMRAVCHAFRIHSAPKEADSLETWDHKLLALVQASRQAGKTVVLVINDAHLAPFFALNHLCRLNTSGPDGQPLMHIVLLCHQSLRKQLEQPELAPTLKTVVAQHPLEDLHADEPPSTKPPAAGTLADLDGDWLTEPEPDLTHHLQEPPPQPAPTGLDFGPLAEPTGRASTDWTVPASSRPPRAATRVARSWTAADARRWAAAPMVALIGLVIWWAWPQASETAPPSQVQAASDTSPVASEALSRDTPPPAGSRERVGGIIDAPSNEETVAPTTTQTTAIDMPEPAMPSEAVPRLAELVDDQSMTWPLLGQLWGISMSGETACEQALTQGVQCFRSNGLDLDQVRAMDRPAMLLLHQEGTDKWVRLLALDEQRARLASTGREWVMPLADLQSLWKSGALATLWRLPPGQSRRVFNAGPQDPAGRWLDEQLRALQSEGELKPSADSYLARVTAFQEVNNLRSDGRATPTTFVLVNRLRRADEPRLLETAER